MATRKASQKVLDALVPFVPGFIGGSADLTGNTGTELAGQTAQSAANPAGRQIYFGVREHAMGSALVGMAKHGGMLPLGGTFLVFSDYMRPAVRLAALSGAQCVFVWTHDSWCRREDGPTHQPVEHVMSLRAIPGLQVIRPADAVETAGAWQLALDTDGPTAIILSRQDLPILEYSSIDGVAQGAYLVADHEAPEVTLIGTGSEVSLCLDAAAALDELGIGARVVSMPCWNAFESLSVDEQDEIISPDIPSVSVEAGVTLGWERHADLAVGIDRFGASAPGSVALSNLGMNVDNIVGAVNELLEADDD
ncbi:MAG: transketolase C-terminal domain-containing protein [Acidimicrobiales bacterium]